MKIDEWMNQALANGIGAFVIDVSVNVSTVLAMEQATLSAAITGNTFLELSYYALVK